MSWTPFFWVHTKEYERVKQELPQHDAWNFTIAENTGVVISGGESSSSNENIHEILEKNKVIHWLVDSEQGHCDFCRCWGEQINSYTEGEIL